MNARLTDAERNDIIAYRMQRANDTLHDADILIAENAYNAAVNRIYYACYYAVSALLLKYSFEYKKHHGAKTLFHQHFIATKKIEIKHSVFFSQLFNSRNEGDYDDFIYFDVETVTAYRTKSTEFIMTIQDELNRQDETL
ncbi:DNA-binding protein [Bacteroidia bacterium]|nr:DNA-binding protein [Bacteroidia bacterium]